MARAGSRGEGARGHGGGPASAAARANATNPARVRIIGIPLGFLGLLGRLGRPLLQDQLSGEDSTEILGCEDRHSQLFRLRGLRAGARSRDNIAGFRRDAVGDPRSQLFDRGPCLLARHAIERAREDEREPRERPLRAPPRAPRGRRRARASRRGCGRSRGCGRTPRSRGAISGPTPSTSSNSSSVTRRSVFSVRKRRARTLAVASPPRGSPMPPKSGGAARAWRARSARSDSPADFLAKRSSPSTASTVSAKTSSSLRNNSDCHNWTTAFLAEAVDRERLARRQVEHPLADLRGARRVGTHQVFPLDHRFGAARRALRRHLERRRGLGALLAHHRHHLGNHVARALDHHRVADPHVELARESWVVERRVGDRDPRERHRHEDARGVRRPVRPLERRSPSRPWWPAAG